MPAANAQDCVFAPAIGARPGMVVGKEFPGCAVWAVVFADRAPLTFGKVWSPSLPVDFASPRFFKPVLLSVRNPGVSSHGRYGLSPDVFVFGGSVLIIELHCSIACAD